MSKPNPPFMSGVPELLILQLLDRREMYGYELVQAIRIVTGDTISLGEGVVYPSLHSLELVGALRSRRQIVNGRSRVYYRLNVKGRRRLAQLIDRWEHIKHGVDAALAGPTVHTPGG